MRKLNEHRAQYADLKSEVERIAALALRHADDVDRHARFPVEAVTALKQAGLLGAMVPLELDGMGCDLPTLFRICQTLGQSCSATAMVFAMHQIQVACLVKHGADDPFVRRYLAELASRQLLLASATSEVGVGGDLRSSLCAVSVERDQNDGERYVLRKEASTISYGEHADDILATARRDATAASSDQVLVVVRRADRTLDRKGNWDTLGMRGTCSPGFVLEARGPKEQVLQAPFADIAEQTMLPVSHALWAGVWLGIAEAGALRAQGFVRDAARKTPGKTPPSALRLAELWTTLSTLRANAQGGLQRCVDVFSSSSAPSMGDALEMNTLKLLVSDGAADVLRQALAICGIAGYRNDSKYALGRYLRDAHSAALMIGNDRLLSNNAALLLVHKERA